MQIDRLENRFKFPKESSSQYIFQRPDVVHTRKSRVGRLPAVPVAAVGRPERRDQVQQEQQQQKQRRRRRQWTAKGHFFDSTRTAAFSHRYPYGHIDLFGLLRAAQRLHRQNVSRTHRHTLPAKNPLCCTQRTAVENVTTGPSTTQYVDRLTRSPSSPPPLGRPS